MTGGILLNGGIAIIVILYGSFVLGHFLLTFFQISINAARSIVTGFAGFFSIFEIFTLLSIFFKLRFSVLLSLLELRPL